MLKRVVKGALLTAFLTPTLALGISMEEAVQTALKNNPLIKSQIYSIKEATLYIKETENLYMPVIFSNLSYTTMNETPYTTVPAGILPFPLKFKAYDKDFSYIDLGVNYYLFTGFARPQQLKVAKLHKKGEEQILKEKVNSLSAEVKRAYLDVLSAKAVVEVYQKQLKAVEKHYSMVKEYYKKGLVAKVDILQTKVKIAKVKRDLKKAEGQLKLAKSKLNTLLNRPIDSKITVEQPKIKPPKNLKLKDLYQRAIHNRYILRYLKTKQEQTKALSKAYLSDFYPKVVLQGKLFWTDQNPYISPKGNVALSLLINWQFQGKAPYYKSLKEKTKALQIKEKENSIKNQIKLQVKKAYNDFKVAVYNLKLSEASVEEAEEYYRMVVEQFKHQLATTTDVLDAESILTGARKEREVSYYQLLKAVVNLQEAVGGCISCEE
ncbi:MAG: TolC family protein [Aquificae bacterium]|nr:TolC family protein [Aquificota bacterium]